MPILSNPAFGPRTAIGYITGGLLLVVWTLVYYFAFVRPEGAISNMTWFWLIGLALTGIVLIFLGAFLGPIGRMARQVELPPAEAIQAEAAIQQTAAAHPNPVVAGATGAVAGQVMPGQVSAVNGAVVPGTVAPQTQSLPPGATVRTY